MLVFCVSCVWQLLNKRIYDDMMMMPRILCGQAYLFTEKIHKEIGCAIVLLQTTRLHQATRSLYLQSSAFNLTSFIRGYSWQANMKDEYFGQRLQVSDEKPETLKWQISWDSAAESGRSEIINRLVAELIISITDNMHFCRWLCIFAYYYYYYYSITPHSFIPGLKPSFSANPFHRSLPFLLQDWLHPFPGLFTDTSEHILLLLFSCPVFHFLVVGSVR